MSTPENDLSARKKLILKAIIDAHITDGEPVGSKYLTQFKQLAYSSATIRNEMAELESMGYLEHPYTSSGRIPSNLGYRFYVDALLQQYKMTAQEIYELNQLMHLKLLELDQLIDRAAKLASTMTRYTGLSIKARPKSETFVRFEAIPLHSDSFVLVMLTKDSSVKTKSVKLEKEIPDESVVFLGQQLTDLLSGISADEITLPKIIELEQRMGEHGHAVSPAVKVVYNALKELNTGDLKVEGADLLLQYPEYSDVDKLRDLFTMFNEKDKLLDIVDSADDIKVNVLIGDENNFDSMTNSTLIFKTIKEGGKVVGAVGVIGPRRMDYSKVITTINSLSSTISGIVNSGRRSLPDGESE